MINLREECQGYYKIEAVKTDGSRRVLADWFPNLILNAGLDRMGTSFDYLNYCQVGSGSTAPAETQTSLSSIVAGTSDIQSTSNANSGASPFFARTTIVFRFAAGTATGVLAEVGVGWSAAGNLFSRALILDALGAPTTISVLPDESLDVTYELRMYAWVGEAAGNITLNGVLHDIVQKSALAGQWSIGGTNRNAADAPEVVAYTGDISALISGSPSGTFIGLGGIAAAAYTPGSMSRTLNVTAGLNQFNDASGIGAIQIRSGWGYWQIGFTPNVMKTSDNILTLQIRHSWGRKA